MEMLQLQILAGTVSSIAFMGGMLSTLFKTWHTRNVESLSLTGLLLNNIGNFVYWIYVISLPFGPIYFLHGFYTFATILMMIWYMLYRHHPQVVEQIADNLERITQTMEMQAIRR